MATLLKVVEIADKIVVHLDATCRRITRWMPELQRMAQLPCNDRPKVKAKNEAEQTRPLNLKLTRRKTHVLRLLARGKANTEISARLQISPHTVKSHVINIFNKLGVNDRIQAAVLASRLGLLD